MMMAENPKITVEVEAKGASSVRQQMSDLQVALGKIEKNTFNTQASIEKLAQALAKTGGATKNLGNQFEQMGARITQSSLKSVAQRISSEQSYINFWEKALFNQEQAKQKTIQKVLEQEQKAVAQAEKIKRAEIQKKQEKDKAYAQWWEQALAKKELKEKTALQKIENQIRNSTQAIKRDTSVIANSFTQLKQALIAYVSIDTVARLAKTADQMRMLEARTINASKSVALGTQNFKELKRIASEAGVALEGTVQVFQRVANTKNSIGATNAELLKMTETVSKLGVLSGASYEAQKNGLIQFAQAMSGGIVRAEEFNSLNENIPEVLRQIEKQMGLTSGQMRKMLLEGKLLSKDVFKALTDSADEVNKKFEKMPITFDRIRTQASIAFGTLVSDIDKSTDASGTLIRFVGRIGKGINDLMPTLKRVFTYLIVGAKASGNLVMSVFDGIVFIISASVENITRSIKQIVNLYNSVENKITKGKFQAPTAGLDETISVSKNFRKSSSKGVVANLNSFGTNFLKSLEVAYGKPLQEKPSKAKISDSRGDVESPVTKSGTKKSGSGKSEAEKELDRYKEALKSLKDKAREAMLEVQGMDKAINALASGGLKAYEAQIKQNEGLGRYNELMGDYLGKGKRELELIAQRIVKQEQDAEAKKKQLELSLQLAEVQRDLNFEEEKAKQLREAFIAGGEKAYELKKRELEIEERRRQLLGDANATEQQKQQAQEIADREGKLKKESELLDKQVSQAKEAGDAIRNALRSAFDNTIEHMVNGTSSFKEIMVGLLRQIAVQLIKVYALQLLTGFIGGRMTGGASAGANAGVFDKIGGAFGISPVTSSGKPTGGFGFGDFLKPNPQVNQLGRATGGAVSANVPYVVGESGREMFVPRSAGNIIPNYAMSKTGGGGAITVVNNMTINTREGDDKNSIMEAGKALSAMMETKVRQILQVESRQGGMLHRSFA